MLPIISDSHSAYQDTFVSDFLKYYPNPFSLPIYISTRAYFILIFILPFVPLKVSLYRYSYLCT